MDTNIGTLAVKTVADLAQNENILNKTTGVMGMLFPFAGLRQKAVEVYIEDIENSDLSAETKVFMILNAKKTFKKIKNQKAIAEIAMENAKQGTDFSENSGVSEEWLDRFMESAGFVSSEEIQLIWGKILANEFDRPGSTPPNMIRVLSEITPDMAKAFRYICSMSVWIYSLKEDGNMESGIKSIFVPYHGNDVVFRSMGLSFDILNELDTLGVMKFDSLAGYILQGFDSKKILIRVGDKTDVIEEHKSGEIPIGNILLTSVGEALCAIIDKVEIDGYYDMVKGYLDKNGIKFADEYDFVVQEKDGTLIIDKRNS